MKTCLLPLVLIHITFGAGADEDTTANINNDDTITAGLFIPQLASIATPTGTHHN